MFSRYDKIIIDFDNIQIYVQLFEFGYLYRHWTIKIPFRKFIRCINNIYYEFLSLSLEKEQRVVWQDTLRNDVIRRALFRKFYYCAGCVKFVERQRMQFSLGACDFSARGDIVVLVRTR